MGSAWEAKGRGRRGVTWKAALMRRLSARWTPRR